MTGRIAADTTLTPVAHFTAVNHSVAELRQVIGSVCRGRRARRAGAARRPAGRPEGEWVQHPDGLRYAADLVRLIKSAGDFCVGVAAFPERHPRSPDLDSRHGVLRAQVPGRAPTSRSPRCSSIADDYLRLRDRVAALGCDVPIIAGIMPVTS